MKYPEEYEKISHIGSCFRGVQSDLILLAHMIRDIGQWDCEELFTVILGQNTAVDVLHALSECCSVLFLMLHSFLLFIGFMYRLGLCIWKRVVGTASKRRYPLQSESNRSLFVLLWARFYMYFFREMWVVMLTTLTRNLFTHKLSCIGFCKQNLTVQCV